MFKPYMPARSLESLPCLSPAPFNIACQLSVGLAALRKQLTTERPGPAPGWALWLKPPEVAHLSCIFFWETYRPVNTAKFQSQGAQVRCGSGFWLSCQVMAGLMPGLTRINIEKYSIRPADVGL